MPESFSTDRLRTVAHLVRRHFMALAPEDTLDDAEQKMRMARVRGLPVVAGERLVGLARHEDVVRCLLENAISGARPDGPRQVADLMQILEAGLPPETSLARAASLLCALGCGFLTVVEPAPGGDRILGLITENDLLRAAWRPRS